MSLQKKLIVFVLMLIVLGGGFVVWKLGNKSADVDMAVDMPVTKNTDDTTQSEAQPTPRTATSNNGSVTNTTKKSTMTQAGLGSKGAIGQIMLDDGFITVSGTVKDPVAIEHVALAIVPTKGGRTFVDHTYNYDLTFTDFDAVWKDEMTTIAQGDTSRKGDWTISFDRVFALYDDAGDAILLMYDTDTGELLDKMIITRSR